MSLKEFTVITSGVTVIAAVLGLKDQSNLDHDFGVKLNFLFFIFLKKHALQKEKQSK